MILSLRRILLIIPALILFTVLGLYLSIPQEAYETYLPHNLPWIGSFGNAALEEQWATFDPDDPLHNRTLGFQGLFAVTKGTPWRVEGLKAAGNYTSLDFDVRPQEDIPVEELTEFIGGHGMSNGSAAAWFGHLNVLKRVRDEKLGSALIFEDDADFDVRIKHQFRDAMERILDLVQVGNASPEEAAATLARSRTATVMDRPYLDLWDVLWIGHCGEDVAQAIPERDSWVDNEKIRMWKDPTVVDKDEYTGFAHNSVYEMPRGARAALWAIGPVCTFAYGVSARSVDKVIREASNLDRGFAFDVAMNALCKNGILRCLIVAPELFHEYIPPHDDSVTTSELAAADGVHHAPPGEILKLGMGWTVNVQRSARCAGLYGTTCFPGRMDPV